MVGDDRHRRLCRCNNLPRANDVAGKTMSAQPFPVNRGGERGRGDHEARRHGQPLLHHGRNARALTAAEIHIAAARVVKE